MDNNASVVEELVKSLLAHMGVEADVTSAMDDGTLKVSAVPTSGLKIGGHADEILALQHLLRSILRAKHPEAYEAMRIVLDIGGFKERQEAQLTESVEEVVKRVRETGKPMFLPPMSSYERRLVHMMSTGWDDLECESVGEEPRRRIMIKPH